MGFAQWLDAFVEEKGLNLDQHFEKIGPSGQLNVIPLANVIQAMKITDKSEQAQIKSALVRLDFRNADVMDYFDHLSGALAI
ncbi:hypothetical protein BKG82_26230 [Mycobacteroides chelonae]|uniref:Uncharacterized protein n=1 Tax=Mycobacteroides chelonae TaxID=1774 RepID=A0A1S1LCM0_MYCCH|nr:hypothetical protein [Mycobacteroides chelonae]OHU47158.1 hypothetical protein BKG82_26230 [Mycobacteroides chelonae]